MTYDMGNNNKVTFNFCEAKLTDKKPGSCSDESYAYVYDT